MTLRRSEKVDGAKRFHLIIHVESGARPRLNPELLQSEHEQNIEEVLSLEMRLLMVLPFARPVIDNEKHFTQIFETKTTAR